RQVAEGELTDEIVGAGLLHLRLDHARYGRGRARDAAAAVLDLIEVRRPLSPCGARAVHVKEMMEVAMPERIRTARNGERLRVRVSHDHEAGETEHRGMRRRERRAVAIGHGAYLRGERIGDQMKAVAAGGLRSIGRARSRPERRMRFLEWLELHRHVG